MNELLKKIETLRAGESALRTEIEKYLAGNEKAQSLSLSGLSLQHRIHDRPVTWINVEDGRVKFWSNKGYFNYINDLPLSDIEAILNHVG